MLSIPFPNPFYIQGISPQHYIIKNELFPRIPKIIRRVISLLSECFPNANFADSPYTFCTQDPCNTYLAVHVNANNTLTLDQLEENSQYIDAVFTIKILPDIFYEIYNVCTSPAFRGRGIMKRLMHDIISILDKSKLSIYLKVDLDNPMIEQVIKLYAGLGFLDSEVRGLPSESELRESSEEPSFKPGLIMNYNFPRSQLLNQLYELPSESKITEAVKNSWINIRDHALELLNSGQISGVPLYIENGLENNGLTLSEPSYSNLNEGTYGDVPNKFYVLIAHGCETNERVDLPSNVRLLMRCNQVTHICSLNHYELYKFISDINPRTYEDFGQKILEESTDWRKNFCVLDGGESYNDFNITADNQGLRTGLYEIPINTMYEYDINDMMNKNVGIDFNSFYYPISNGFLYKMSNILEIISQRGGGTLMSILCRQPCYGKVEKVPMNSLESDIIKSGTITLGVHDIEYELPSSSYPIARYYNNQTVIYDSSNDSLYLEYDFGKYPLNMERVGGSNRYYNIGTVSKNGITYNVHYIKPNRGKLIFYISKQGGRIIEITPEDLSVNYYLSP